MAPYGSKCSLRDSSVALKDMLRTIKRAFLFILVLSLSSLVGFWSSVSSSIKRKKHALNNYSITKYFRDIWENSAEVQ